MDSPQVPVLLILPRPEERPDDFFSAGFSTILNKYGVLSYEIRTSEILEIPESLSSYRVLLIASFSVSSWRPEYTQSLQRFRGTVFFEGPIPAELSDLTGCLPESIQHCETVFCQPQGEELKQGLETTFLKAGQPLRFYGSSLLSQKGICLNRRQYRVRRRRRIPESENPETAILLRLLDNYALFFENRLAQTGRFAKSLSGDLAVLLGFLKLNMFPSKEKLDAMRHFWEAEKASSPVTPEDWLLLTGMARFNHFFSALKEDWESAQNVPDVEEMETFLEEAISRGLYFSRPLGSFSANFRWKKRLAGLLRRRSPHHNYDWLKHLYLLLQAKPDNRNRLPNNLKTLLGALQIGKAQSVFGKNEKPIWYLWVIILVMETGNAEKAVSLSKQCLDRFVHEPSGLLVNDTGQPLEHSGWILIALACFYDLLVSKPPTNFGFNFLDNWEDREAVYLENQLADRKAVGEIPVQRVQPNAAKILLDAKDSNGRDLGPALLCHEYSGQRFFTFTFPVFSYLASYHLVPPMPGTYMHVVGGTFNDALEHLLMHFLFKSLLDSGIPLPRINPWPENAPWCFTLRRDVDRALADEQFQTLSANDEALGLKASWYWLQRNFRPELAQKIVSDGNENGWHAEIWSQGKDSPHFMLDGNGALPWGVTAHGGLNADGWQGQNSLDVYRELNLKYCDTPGAFSFFPYTPLLCKGSDIEAADFLCMPTHFSFDKSARETYQQEALDGVRTVRRLQGCYILMHHPDLHLSEVVETTASLAKTKNFISLTAKEVASWWNETHDPASLRMQISSSDKGFRLLLTSKVSLKGLSLGIPLNSGHAPAFFHNGESLPFQESTGFMLPFANITLDLSAGSVTTIEIINK